MFESEVLNMILDFELKNGNEIVEVSDWPPKCEKLIILKHRFHKKFESPHINFKEIKDSHYWFSQYNTDEGNECLACR